jgi:hypothetical protein
MGANQFSTRARGTTAEIAFRAAVDEAGYEHGHGGYSGTIAEKRSFVVISVPKGRDPAEYANSDEAMAKVDDKWGPAGCVKIADGEWLFFGWASS